MFQDNPLLAQLKQHLHAQTPRVEGVVKGTDKGFGFLEVDAQTSYFIPPPQMKKVMHGDRIVAALQTDKERQIAEPESLIEPFLSRFIGRVQKKKGDDRVFVIPDHPILKDSIAARAITGLESPLQEGDWVVAEMKRHPLRGDRNFYAEIQSWITQADDPKVPWMVTLSRHQLDCEAPHCDESQLILEDIEREDLTDLHFMTIDSASTEDMDDALYVEDLGDAGLELWVAIADPTAYIAEDTELDALAKHRAFTHYLPGFNIPMLPRVLSDDLCSLRPMQKRPALVCRVTVLPDGSLSQAPHFCLAWIESKAKLVYDEVSDWLEGQGEWQPDQDAIAVQIRRLQQLAERRHAWRQQHALVFKDRPDYHFILDDQGNVLDIAVELRRIANHMVEEAMITANISAARFLQDKLGYGIFNVHAGFEPSQVDLAVEVLKTQGVDFQAQSLLTLSGFCELRRYLDTQPTPYLDSRIRRFQCYAEISTQPAPHFGLGLEAYATWTSPIRKYGDMINHRLLKALIHKIDAPVLSEGMSQHLSDRRRLNRMAERDVSDWLYVRYLHPRVAESHRHPAEVIDVSRGGMRVRLLDVGAVAFMPAPLMHTVRDELVCQPDNGIVLIKGEEAYRQGDTLEVILHEVRIETRSVIVKPAV